MKRALTKTGNSGVYYFVAGNRVSGCPDKLSGDVSDLWGDVSGLRGDVSDLRGNVGYHEASGKLKRLKR